MDNIIVVDIHTPRYETQAIIIKTQFQTYVVEFRFPSKRIFDAFALSETAVSRF